MAKRDFYETLGVPKDADEAALKKAFRAKAMQFHPDRNPGNKHAEEKFKEVNEAYEILNDPQKRAAYDRFGHAAFEQGGAPRGEREFHFGGGSGGFADIFAEMFGDIMGGRGGRQQGPVRGDDLRFNLEISLEEAFAGAKKNIRVSKGVSCESCGGSGGEGGARPRACTTCAGRGRVGTRQGFFTVERTCPTCQGTGQTIDKPCRVCLGQGRTQQERTLAVAIPAGVDEGTRIRLGGEGEAGLRGAPAGDLYVFISIAPHQVFTRDGASIFCQVPIPMTTAALGGKVEVPTVEGARLSVDIKSGTQTGDQFRLRGKGMSILRRPDRGDMIIEVLVETPQNLNAKQRQLLEEFRKAGGDEASPKSQSFFKKVRELWDGLKGG